jgi:acylphosphatase
MPLAFLQAKVEGRVQGIYFRSFVKDKAISLGLTGYVRNTIHGEVEVKAEGDKEKLTELIAHLRTGPPRAKVERVEVAWSDYSSRFPSFKIVY